MLAELECIRRVVVELLEEGLQGFVLFFPADELQGVLHLDIDGSIVVVVGLVGIVVVLVKHNNSGSSNIIVRHSNSS